MTVEEAHIIRLHDGDNVAIARRCIEQGATIAGTCIEARDKIPPGHKIALRPIMKGEPILKYNQIIGFASQNIDAGAHVHTHNSEIQPFHRNHEPCSEVRQTNYIPVPEQATFEGYVRESGQVGTRNYLGILTSVNCSATVARHIAEVINRSGELDDYPHVDGVVALVHGTGCGMEAGGEAHEILERVLAGYARHPNFAGVLIIGLGCEVCQVGGISKNYGLDDSKNFRTMTIQETGGTRRTIERGVAALRDMLPNANQVRRQSVPASHLTLALQCGGSDAYSGVSANPALGAAVDLLVRHGGSAILSETPEIYGAEHLLTLRAATPEIAEKLMERIHWWEDYTARSGGEMNNNPSPGNKEGGLTTILEKSLGAVAKGGTTNLVDVYRYAEPLTSAGFAFMDSPGYDPVSVTGQVAAGANVICFTTGRGSVFGFKPVPSIKLATTSSLYMRMQEDMDINCGVIVDGTSTVQQMGAAIFARILEVASGEKTCSERLGFGDDEFAPWQIGAVM